MKSVLSLSDKEMYQEINLMHKDLVSQLRAKGIDYGSLKSALIPNQDKDKQEIALVFDSTRVKSGMYGYEVFDKLLPVLSSFENSTYSISCGDILGSDNNHDEYERLIEHTLKNELNLFNSITYEDSSQYYVVHINTLTEKQVGKIVEAFREWDAFIGFNELRYTRDSKLKTILSMSLLSLCIINKKTAILPHMSDMCPEENINMCGYPFEENGYGIISIDPDLFSQFLSYKIESIIPDDKDLLLSINSISGTPHTLSDFNLIIEDNKFNNNLKSNIDKLGILKSLGLDNVSKSELETIIETAINLNYIYNLDYRCDSVMFNVCIELKTSSGSLRRTTVSLEYKYDEKLLRLITIT